jgi:hypothetical protein
MHTKIIEVTNGFNWGKFLVGRLDERELLTESLIDPGANLLRSIGYSPFNVIVIDLQTQEGACFYPRGHAGADLKKHRVWVCPMFEPFLAWLYKQDCHDVRGLPNMVTLTQEETFQHTAMWGYRRPGAELFEEGAGI